jgi:hypothetical protein
MADHNSNEAVTIIIIPVPDKLIPEGIPEAIDTI